MDVNVLIEDMVFVELMVEADFVAFLIAAKLLARKDCAVDIIVRNLNYNCKNRSHFIFTFFQSLHLWACISTVEMYSKTTNRSRYVHQPKSNKHLEVLMLLSTVRIPFKYVLTILCVDLCR